MRAGGIFGSKPTPGLGIFLTDSSGRFMHAAAAGLGADVEPPYPDTYSCNSDSECRSGFCNTGVKLAWAAGQCQTRGQVNPGVADAKERATGTEPGDFCSSKDDCSGLLTCDTGQRMCVSALDPKNGCYRAGQMGFQDGLAGAPNRAQAVAASLTASLGMSAASTSQLVECYNREYASAKAQVASYARPCTDRSEIMRVQRALGVAATGTWDVVSADALRESGRSFTDYAKGCTGAAPKPSTKPAGGGGTTTPTTKPTTKPTTTGSGDEAPPAKKANIGLLLGVGLLGIGAIMLLTDKKKKDKAGKKASKRSPSRRPTRRY